MHITKTVLRVGTLLLFGLLFAPLWASAAVPVLPLYYTGEVLVNGEKDGVFKAWQNDPAHTRVEYSGYMMWLNHLARAGTDDSPESAFRSFALRHILKRIKFYQVINPGGIYSWVVPNPEGEVAVEEDNPWQIARVRANQHVWAGDFAPLERQGGKIKRNGSLTVDGAVCDLYEVELPKDPGVEELLLEFRNVRICLNPTDRTFRYLTLEIANKGDGPESGPESGKPTKLEVKAKAYPRQKALAASFFEPPKGWRIRKKSDPPKPAFTLRARLNLISWSPSLGLSNNAITLGLDLGVVTDSGWTGGFLGRYGRYSATSSVPGQTLSTASVYVGKAFSLGPLMLALAPALGYKDSVSDRGLTLGLHTALDLKMGPLLLTGGFDYFRDFASSLLGSNNFLTGVGMGWVF